MRFSRGRNTGCTPALVQVLSQRAGSFCPIPALRAGGLADDKTIQLYCLLAMLVIVLHLALAIASINLHLQSNTIRTAENTHA